LQEAVMPKVRSPNYPTTDLGTALELIRPAFKAENRNKMSRLVLANHMGDKTLNGRALTKLGAVRAYGLIEGSSDQLRLSDDAVLVLASPNTINVQYRDALERLAFKPPLFQEIKKEFPATLPSENNLSFWLVQKHFTQEAAGKAAQSFLTTMRLVYSESEGYNPPVDELDEPMPSTEAHILDRPVSSFQRPPLTQEKFDLDEGPVTLSVPSVLSPESYQDLADRIEILLRGLKRRSDAESAKHE
jgi:hypothetical protein